VVYRWVLGVAMTVGFSCDCCGCFLASLMTQSVKAWHWFGLQFSAGARVGSSMMHL